MVLANSSDVALGSDWAASEIQSLQCLNATEDIGGLVGTAFVARDMAQIVDALGEDGLLRYWGEPTDDPSRFKTNLRRILLWNATGSHICCNVSGQG